MSAVDNVIGNIQQISNTVSSGLNTVARLGADLGLGGVGGNGVFWKDQLRTASFRGVPFGVLSSEGHFGRRNAVHEYPFRDSVWVEDMGRAARRIGMTGFLVENGIVTPGTVIAQRDRMITAAETAGSSTLIHPTLGSMDISLLDFEWRERWDLGRVIELTFHFVESGARTFPEVKASTTSAVLSAAGVADLGAGADFLTKASVYLKQGISAVTQVVGIVQKYVRIAQNVVNGATNLFHLAQTLTGQFGRFSQNAGSNAPSSSLPGLVAQAAVSRASVVTASNALSTSAAALSTTNASSHPAVAQALAAAVLSASPNPLDAINSLAAMMVLPTSSSTMAGASSDLFRRAAVVAIARAGASYQPTSYDDAANVRTQISNYLNAEILIAADQGEDATYAALRDLRARSIQDLTERGASLASLVTVTSVQPMPSLIMAQRLYQDITREDELIMEAAPVHPLFMPTKFKALAS